MLFLQRFKAWGRQNADMAYELVRIYLGLGLFVKGVHFILNAEFLVDTLISAGNLRFADTVIAHLVGMGHLAGGAFLAVGLITRVAAALQLPILAGAVLFVGLPEGLFAPSQSLEFSALVLFLLLVFAVFGGGRWSVDVNVLQKDEGAFFPTAKYKNEMSA